MKNEIKIAESLVSIPSYVDNKSNEAPIIQWLSEWCKATIPDMEALLYPVADDRSNLYLGSTQPKVLFVGHVDTVPVASGWESDPFELTQKAGRLYGLGIADMKGSIASLLAALSEVEPAARADVGVLLYVDEEYAFAGMRKAITDIPFILNVRPELIISLDGNIEVLNGCRGLVALDFEVLGRAGHASNPANGLNVITNLTECFQDLNGFVSTFTDKALGTSTMNVAYLNAGPVTDVKDVSDMQRIGNIIPNYADCSIELRIANSGLTASVFTSELKKRLEGRGLSLLSSTIKIDLGAWVPKNSQWSMDIVRRAYKNANVAFVMDDPKYRGYIDVQMLADKLPSPIYVLGAGGDNKHGANENTSLENLTKAKLIYKNIIKSFCPMNGLKNNI